MAWPCRLLPLLICSALALPARGADPVPPSSTPEASAPDSAQPAPERMIDNVRSSVDDLVQNTVRAVDRFFVTDDFATFDENKTRLRLRLDTDYLEHHGWEVSPKLKVHLVLPGLKERLRLVINDDQGPDVDQDTPNDDDSNDVALRWIGIQEEALSLSFDLGLRLRGGNPDPFARVNAGVEYPLARGWTGRSTNRLYYYADTGWRSDFRQYFNHALGEDLLFRSRTRLQYFEENVRNPFVEQKLSLFQTLQRDRALAWEVLWRRVSEEDSPFSDSEIRAGGSDYQHFIAQLRYRQQFLREWLYVELWPIVLWPEEREYQTSLGFRLRFEMNIGDAGDKRLDE